MCKKGCWVNQTYKSKNIVDVKMPASRFLSSGSGTRNDREKYQPIVHTEGGGCIRVKVKNSFLETQIFLTTLVTVSF
jgi:hypothetical protein